MPKIHIYKLEMAVGAFARFGSNYSYNYPDIIFSFIFYITGILIIRRGINFVSTLPNSIFLYFCEEILFGYIIIRKLQFGHCFKNVRKNIKAILKSISIFFVGLNINNINFTLFRDNLDVNKRV